jgi:glycosyltransferase involved in cell wall biosynthesis
MKVAILTTDNREDYRDYKAPVPCFGTAPAALLQGFALLPEVEVHVVSCTQVPMAAPEKLAPNIFFHSLHVPKIGWMRTAYQGTVRAVRRRLRDIQPMIAHGQGTERDCCLNAVFSGFPNVLTIHGNMRAVARVNRVKPLSFYWLAARLEALTLPRAAGVVCITHYTERAVRNLARRTWVVPNAVDASFFEVSAAPPPAAPPRILCVGVVCGLKNQNGLIQALDALAQRRPLEVVFLGATNEDDAYSGEFSRLLRERPWCVYGGVSSREQLKEHLRQASLLALPSFEENCPMVLLEAMASGVPVLAAKVGGVPDLIQDGETGVFCDPHDAASIRTGVERILANPTAARQMAWRAKLVAQERFHPRTVAQQHVAIYREVLQQRAADLSAPLAGTKS